MQLFAPDILTDARELSTGLSLAGLVVGFLVWLTGWWGHRFWIVLVATLLAGIFGLLSSPAHRVQPLVGGLLLAVAAGVLALALVRVVAFAAGGVALWLAVHALAPPPWDDPLICFLAGGLVGLLLFRVWTMALTSFAGALLMCYSSLCLADRLGKVNAVDLAEQRASLLTGVCLLVAAVGLVVQFMLERRRSRNERWREQFRYLSEEELEQLYGHWRWWPFKRRQYRRAS